MVGAKVASKTLCAKAPSSSVHAATAVPHTAATLSVTSTRYRLSCSRVGKIIVQCQARYVIVASAEDLNKRQRYLSPEASLLCSLLSGIDLALAGSQAEEIDAPGATICITGMEWCNRVKDTWARLFKRTVAHRDVAANTSMTGVPQATACIHQRSSL